MQTPYRNYRLITTKSSLRTPTGIVPREAIESGLDWKTLLKNYIRAVEVQRDIWKYLALLFISLFVLAIGLTKTGLMP